MTEELLRRGAEVEVVTRLWKREVGVDYVTQVRTGKGEAPGYSLWALRSLREVRRRRPDLVHCHGLEGAIVCSALRFSRVRTVFHLHNSLTREASFFRSAIHRVGYRILEEGCKSASAVICPTEAVRADLLSNIPTLGRERVRVIPNMVGKFEPWPRERVDALRAGLGVGSRKVVLYFGKVKRSKGIEDLCRAYEMLGEKDRVALIIGGAPTWTENFLKRLREDFPDVIFTGFVDDPAPYYQMADLFCIYTDSFEGGETFAISLAEAMSFGVPVVCSENPIYREVTQGAAFFVPPKDPARLSGAIRDALKDSGLAAEVAASAKRTAAENYSPSAVASKVEELYLGDGGALANHKRIC